MGSNESMRTDRILSQESLRCCALADAILAEITPSSAIPANRMEFPALKSCVTKRTAISDELNDHWVDC
jgi:hypothetical protein